MASRKEQKEKLRREREEREAQAKAAQRRKQMVGYAAGGLAVAVIVVVAVVLLASGRDGGGDEPDTSVLPDGGSVAERKITELGPAAKAAGCTRQSVKGKSREHTEDLAEKIQYDSNPPSEGKHFAAPADDGAYDEAPDVKELVHTLEHGRIIIWFKKNLPEDQRADLKALFDEDSYQMVLTPDPTNMKYDVAATAWSREPVPNGTGRLLGCAKWDGDKTMDALQAFRDEYRGDGPEAVP